jgi:hypothetical protein
MSLQNKYVDKRQMTKPDYMYVPWILFGALILLLLIVISPALDTITTPVTLTKVDRAFQNPSNETASKVAFNGKIERLVSSRAFTINDPSTTGNENVLVVSLQPLQAVGGGNGELLYNKNDTVKVRGDIKIFNMQEVEKDLGINLDPSVFGPWEGKPYIEAETVNQAK